MGHRLCQGPRYWWLCLANILSELDVDVGGGRLAACALVQDSLLKCADDTSFVHNNLGIWCKLPVFPYPIAYFGEDSGCFAYTFVQLHLKGKGCLWLWNLGRWTGWQPKVGGLWHWFRVGLQFIGTLLRSSSGLWLGWRDRMFYKSGSSGIEAVLLVEQPVQRHQQNACLW